MFSQDNTCPDLLDFTLGRISDTGLSPTMATLSRVFSYPSQRLRANPLSLAATQGISVDFFSSGYLDVSVLRVSFLTDSPKTGFPHSEIAGSKLVCQLPRAYRRLQRPSSPLIAKASTVCTSVLDHTILELTKRSFMHGTDYTINADL